MYKKILVGLVLFGILTTTLAACGIYDESSVPQGPTAHMSGAVFVTPTITISKGQSITLVDDVAVEHIIKNGTWKNGIPDTTKEAGAPTVDATFTGNDSSTIGPFNTSGKFELYCTIHQNMNLTVTVS